MGHGPSTRKSTDVTRGVKAVLAAGQRVRAIRFHADGGFTVLVGEPAPDEVEAPNEWDEVFNGKDQAQARK